MSDLNTPEHDTLAVDVLYTLWVSIDPDFKSKYARDIWGIFQSRVNAAAQQTGALSRFIAEVCKKLNGMTLVTNDATRFYLEKATRPEHANAVLDNIRENYPYLVALLRARMADIRAHKAATAADTDPEFDEE
jgi:hypothetical protein